MAADAESWITALSLKPHPEGGHFKETWRSEERFDAEAMPARFASARALGTAIYYLLRAGECSRLHRLRADEVWHLYSGGPLTLHLFTGEGEYHERTLGLDSGAGQAPQLRVPHGCWFGAELPAGVPFALAGCTVSPGFEYHDFELADRSALLSRHPDHADVVTRLTEA